MPITLVLGVIGADVHAVGTKILEQAFSQAGFNMINLGVMVSQEEFIEAAIETSADAILVSSLYGHGELDCLGLREKCTVAGLNALPLYIGGNLVVGKTPFSEVEQTFKKMGFTRVYSSDIDLETAIADIKDNLGVENHAIA